MPRPTECGNLGRETLHQLHLSWEHNLCIARFLGSLCIVSGGFSVLFAMLAEPLIFALLMAGAVACIVGVWYFERKADLAMDAKRRIVYGRTWGVRSPKYDLYTTEYDLFDPSDPSDPETEIYPVGNGESPSRRRADEVRPGGRPHWHKTTGY